MRPALAFCVCAALAGCAGTPSKPTLTLPRAARAGTDPAFARLVEEYVAQRLAAHPTEATSLGVHDFDDKLEDLSRAGVQRRAKASRAFLARLERIDRGHLSLDEQVDAALLEGQLRAELFDAETEREWARNPMGYVSLPGSAIDSLIKREFAPPRERLVKVIARLEQLPAIYDALRTNVSAPPRVFTELAAQMARGAIGFFSTSVPAWAKKAAAGDDALWTRFQEANGRVVEATRAIRVWLEEDLLPRSTGAYALGEERFREKLRHEEHVELPLAQLLARGEARLKADHDAAIEVARRIDAQRNVAEVMHGLSDEHPTAEDLIPSVRRSVEAARRFLVDKGLVTLPSEVLPKIEETPPYDRAGSFASMDTAGPFENKATESFYYVTPVEPDWDVAHREDHLRQYNPWVLAMINVHEAYPGHYLQFLWAPKVPTLARQVLGAASNSEGWAHYTEQMMMDEGFGGGDARAQLAQLQEALVRDARYVAGIKLHTAGWTVEQAADLFREQAFMEPANALAEAKRGAYNPTYLYYTFGKLEILELRKEYLARGHTLREFHDAFIAQGPLPLPLMRKILLR
jgi:uncharacterized protein (DUF885 family)